MKRTLSAVVALLALTAVACGGGDGDGDGDSSASGNAPARTVEIDMMDIAFAPTTVTAEEGERVRFMFRNRGAIPHDAFIGDADAQADHERDMRDAETGGHSMGGGDEDEDNLTLKPGKTGELTYTFDRAGSVEIGCHQPEHYAAGMKVAVTVT